MPNATPSTSLTFAGSPIKLRNILLFFTGVGVLYLVPHFLDGKPFELRLLTVIFLYAVMGQSWNILGGYAGQVSIGHAVFFGLGAYTSTIAFLNFGLNPWIGGLLAVGVSALAGVLIGIPCFRLRSHYFVIATLVVAESVFLII
jgi:branched-chain amino acid transport system permease protein